MKKIITQLNIKTINMILALTLIWIGFVAALRGADLLFNIFHNGFIAVWTNMILLVVISVLSLNILLKDAMKKLNIKGSGFLKVFNWNKLKFVKTIIFTLKLLLAMMLLALIVSIIEKTILKIVPVAHPMTKNPLKNALILPLQIVFEEAWSAVNFICIANVTYKLQKNKNYDKTFLVATITTAIIFGLAHIDVYWSGNLLKTVLHVLLAQGSTRLLLNWSVKKTDSFLPAYIAHISWDLLMVIIAYLYMH